MSVWEFQQLLAQHKIPRHYSEIELAQDIESIKTGVWKSQQAELEEIWQIAKLAEQKAKDMSDLATAISLKYQKRLHEANQEATDEC